MEEAYDPHNKSFFRGFRDNAALSFGLIVVLLMAGFYLVDRTGNGYLWFVIAILFVALEIGAIRHYWNKDRKYSLGLLAGLSVPFLILGSCFGIIL